MTDHATGLDRFIKAQENEYAIALAEIKAGRKRSHWMWYIFPQIAGLGMSDMSRRYAIRDIEEADAYLHHPLLGARIVEISNALVQLDETDPHAIFGSPDDMKLRSSMTLFAAVEGADPVFNKVLDKLFKGTQDQETLTKL
ncbi:DUF1810 domain-containing protein [Mucilaginibacter myungsuensis]|uniref:DUF1810 domain-containing protein n=1 Tax=Mucilaginibacter myungsuensis TaxID=649104 RepID=A0A929PWC7_9SPHI|nr:DUF1810 domain-containing protein [Mucilaginibacter myungsuensis]MBE9662703.1 DUF1810 domain-containing protein [Mucilaginibacter myungsuensis]MDN3598123.1 DUF1810 domain-containing protein [Mucilaginibacter myungsuensis]